MKVLFSILLFFISLQISAQNVEWTKTIGGVGNDYGHSINVDNAGNIYTTGYFEGTVDFDPDTGVYNLTTTYIDIFIQKVDPSGNLIWAKSIGGSDAENGYSIDVDASGNIYTVGQFTGTCDFDPGAGVTNLTSSGGLDFFVQKMDASGNFLWAKRMGDATDQYAYSINIDNTGSIYYRRV